ncbi:MAG: SDR family oxidoreductase [Candidatus Velthaea sp.]
MGRPLAVITGASSGIGLEFARKLAPRYDLLLVARRKALLDSAAAELSSQSGSAVDVLEADLADPAGVEVVANRLAAEPKLALLVNNAGFGTKGLFWETHFEAQERMHRLHVMATLRLCRAALEPMVKRNAGAIINVASLSAFVRSSGSVSYAATKSWMTAFTEGLFLELKSARSSVRVQALCPGFTSSGFHDVAAVRRDRLAPSSWWMTAAQVVDASLLALHSGTLIVIPGWRYKAIAFLFSKAPTPLRLYLESSRPPRE